MLALDVRQVLECLFCGRLPFGKGLVSQLDQVRQHGIIGLNLPRTCTQYVVFSSLAPTHHQQTDRTLHVGKTLWVKSRITSVEHGKTARILATIDTKQRHKIQKIAMT